jgi:hypothetical protein
MVINAQKIIMVPLQAKTQVFIHWTIPGSNDKLFLAFFKKFFYTFLHIFTYFQYLNIDGKGLAAQVVVLNPEALERPPGRLLLSGRALRVTRSGKWMAAEFVLLHPEALERLPSRLLLGGRALRVTGGGKWVAAQFVLLHPEALERLPGRLLDRSVLRGNLLLLGVSVGVNVDDGVGRRHDELFVIFYNRHSAFIFNHVDIKMTIPFYFPGVK